MIHVKRRYDVSRIGHEKTRAFGLIQIKAGQPRRIHGPRHIVETDMRTLWALGAGFLIAAAAFGGRAVAHWREMTMFGPICGDATVHCGWCYAAEASLLAAAISFAFAIADERAAGRVRLAAGGARTA